MKQVQQEVVLILITVFAILGYFAGLNHADRDLTNRDLNRDGAINLEDFSMALDIVDDILVEVRNQKVPANVIEDVYPDVPPYSPHN